ncbi:flavin reductase family protein [Phenylobacterium soli]|uniref:Flavin reductase n=1 Tax=Phenylobacterium soli TaxID=2170551 RepID=A0A328APB4_9CAUL|nr:flavin reductase family protein [Phenylobacterium soli]RAK55686.1 flavin reductase [Phenylobacterium soli]
MSPHPSSEVATPRPTSGAVDRAGFDTRAFRDALGAFATGVTVITTVDRDGVPAGVTSSSFNSVSLCPPMVLWSLGRASRSLAAFQGSQRFAVHVLQAGQEPLAAQFASKAQDKFAGLRWSLSDHGTPDLRDCAARFECRTAAEHDGGDHVLILGKVLDLRLAKDAAPLVFHRGAFRAL